MGISNKFKDFFGIPEEEREEISEVEELEPEIPKKVDEEKAKRYSRNTEYVSRKTYSDRNKVSMKEKIKEVPNPSSDIVICNYVPTDHSECPYIIDDVKNGKPVIINFEKIEGDPMTNRVFYICEGAAYALDADIVTLSKGMIIISPKNVDIKNFTKKNTGDYL